MLLLVLEPFLFDYAVGCFQYFCIIVIVQNKDKKIHLNKKREWNNYWNSTIHFKWNVVYAVKIDTNIHLGHELNIHHKKTKNAHHFFVDRNRISRVHSKIP